MPFRWVLPLSVFSIQCPHCVRKSSSSISLRNAIKKSNSFSRHLSFKTSISYLVAAFTMLPTPVHSFQAWSYPRYLVRLNSLAPCSIRSEPCSRTFSHRFPSPSHRQHSYPLVSKGEFLSCLAHFFILISERLSRGKVLHIGPAAFFISLAVSPSSAFRLGSPPGALGWFF